MSLSLTTDIILKSVGKRVKNSRNESLGEIIEVIRNASDSTIEYVILRSNQIFDEEDRFFAIPVASTRIKISEGGEIILFTNKNELHHANATTPNQCPSPDFHVNPLIFELLEYNDPKI